MVQLEKNWFSCKACSFPFAQVPSLRLWPRLWYWGILSVVFLKTSLASYFRHILTKITVFKLTIFYNLQKYPDKIFPYKQEMSRFWSFKIAILAKICVWNVPTWWVPFTIQVQSPPHLVEKSESRHIDTGRMLGILNFFYCIVGAIQLTILLDLLALIGCVFFFFLGCDNLKIAGATFPYFNR